MPGYYQRRRHLEYYRVVREWVAELRTRGSRLRSALDVGSHDCPIVTQLGIPLATALDLTRPRQFPGCEWITGDILDCPLPLPAYDLVLCLECLEHIQDVDRAIARLRQLARKALLVSLPYRWDPDLEPSHLHNHIDEAWIARHLGPPSRQRICGHGRAQHIVCLYHQQERHAP